MVVEDESVISQKIINDLEAFLDDNSILLARTLNESLAYLDSHSLKLIILDLSLPDGNGIKLLNKIKDLKMEIIVYVFSINTELEKICISKGATAFFDKSNGLDNLLSTIKSAFSI